MTIFEKVIFKFLNLQINNVYNKNFKKYGESHESVFWNSQFNQFKRYEEILELLIQKEGIKKKIEVSDVGCGYGTLYKLLNKENKFKNISYSGIDINKKFIDFCQNKYVKELFCCTSFPPKMIDYCLMSGTYNLTKIKNVNLWENYVYKNLVQCSKKVKKGLIFNLQFSKKAKIHNNIFYCDPVKIRRLFADDFYVYSRMSSILKNDIIFVLHKKIN